MEQKTAADGIRAGFDYSWTEASFSCTDMDGRILFDEWIELPPRNASSLPDWMIRCLAGCGKTFDDICEWSVGNGPGSFTGLRLAAAFVLGRSFGKDVRKRAVSTASAMALSAGLAGCGKPVGALFDGRRDELLLFGLEEKNGSFVPNGIHAVLSARDLTLLESFGELVCLSRDREQIHKVAGMKAESRLHTVDHIKASGLILNDPDNFSVPLTEPVYLRPAVFVEPKIPRAL